MMQTSVTSESSTLSGLATGPVPGSALGVGSAPGGLAFDNDASYAVMNDKVQALAGSIYEELERMITKYDQARTRTCTIFCFCTSEPKWQKQWKKALHHFHSI